MLSHADRPQTVNAAICCYGCSGLAIICQKIMRVPPYGGLLRFHGYAEKPDGSLNTYAGGETENRWKNHYKLELSTLPIGGFPAISGFYPAVMEISVTDFRREKYRWRSKCIFPVSKIPYNQYGQIRDQLCLNRGMFNGISVAGDSVYWLRIMD